MINNPINSDESEGIFNEFIEEQLDDLIENILQDGTLENIADRGSDVIVEMDQIEPPRFVYDSGGAGGGKGKGQIGKDGEKIRFTLPFNKIMELIAAKLGLPDLTKEGQGKINEITHEFKTFGPVGVLLDKKRTFKRALKTSIATGLYDPANKKHDFQIRRRDKRFKLPEQIEKPKFKASVFYMGDISYSTHGERIALEKQMVQFIQNWLDYNYGPKAVEHRFFVHDFYASEVLQDEFFKVSNAGGTYASSVFDLVSQIALSEYDPQSTNLYAFYFGDGEIFEDDGRAICKIMEENMIPYFNRIGIVEVMPSRISSLLHLASSKFDNVPSVRATGMKDKTRIIPVIKTLFGQSHAKH